MSAVMIESRDLSTGRVVSGKLSLVDLAGSERVSKTGASGSTFKEAKEINRFFCCLVCFCRMLCENGG